MMIDNSKLIELLLEANPSLNDNWSAFIAERGSASEHPLDHLFFADCAKNISEEVDLDKLFEILEQVYTNGCSSSKKQATITFLEILRKIETKELNIGQHTLKQLNKLEAYYSKGHLISDGE